MGLQRLVSQLSQDRLIYGTVVVPQFEERSRLFQDQRTLVWMKSSAIFIELLFTVDQECLL